MTEVTYFVALPFVAADDGVTAGDLHISTLNVKSQDVRLGNARLAV